MEIVQSQCFNESATIWPAGHTEDEFRRLLKEDDGNGVDKVLRACDDILTGGRNEKFDKLLCYIFIAASMLESDKISTLILDTLLRKKLIVSAGQTTLFRTPRSESYKGESVQLQNQSDQHPRRNQCATPEDLLNRFFNDPDSTKGFLHKSNRLLCGAQYGLDNFCEALVSRLIDVGDFSFVEVLFPPDQEVSHQSTILSLLPIRHYSPFS
jgi:hypothetical protein